MILSRKIPENKNNTIIFQRADNYDSKRLNNTDSFIQHNYILLRKNVWLYKLLQTLTLVIIRRE